MSGSVLATCAVGRVGPRVLLVAGGPLGAAGFAWFAAAVAVDGGFLLTAPGPSTVASVGTGLCLVPLDTAATTAVPAGEPVLLKDENRSRWNRMLLARGVTALAEALPPAPRAS
ncbi:hypothetical protein [Streptomyces sp. NPDC007929]|uniref:hypothetical protein n=1 Tax=unclassified Streptomyces TaxID=2593676 RepID=UPI0036F0F73E